MKKLKLVFDIGANLGKSADILRGVSDKIICFEANPQLVGRLRTKFNNSNIVVDNRGLSDKSGKQKFNICTQHTISTFSDDWIKHSRFSEYTWDETVEIETTTLDAIIDQYGIPDYVKIDIEGYEYEVLTAFTKVIDNSVFAFEWAEEQKYKIDEILKYVYKIGYNKFGYTIGDHLLFDSQIEWFDYNDLNLINTLNEHRKTKWGMIYFKPYEL